MSDAATFRVSAVQLMRPVQNQRSSLMISSYPSGKKNGFRGKINRRQALGSEIYCSQWEHKLTNIAIFSIPLNIVYLTTV
jgi:hypothetical protein